MHRAFGLSRFFRKNRVENDWNMPEKHRKSGTFVWKAPLRYCKDTTFYGQKQIVLKWA